MITVNRERSFNRIVPIWKELWEQNNTLSEYQSVAYMKVSWKYIICYCVILRIRPVFFVFKKDGRPILILPLFKKIGRNEYYLYGYKAGFGYLDAVYSNGISNCDFSKCFEVLKTRYGSLKINVNYVKENTNFGNWIISGNENVLKTEYTVIELPDDYDVYFSGLSKNTKQNIRTAYNRLTKDGHEYMFEAISYKDIEAMKRKKVLDLYIERQKEHYGRKGLYSFFVRYIDLGTKIQREICIDEYVLIFKIDGEISAFFDAVIGNREVLVPRLAIDNNYARYSPGMLLMNESMKYFIKEKHNRIDLTHGAEKYKLSMGGVCGSCINSVIRV